MAENAHPFPIEEVITAMIIKSSTAFTASMELSSWTVHRPCEKPGSLRRSEVRRRYLQSESHLPSSTMTPAA